MCCGRFLLQHAFERCCVTDEIKDYHEQNFYDVLLPKSVDVIYDCVGQTGTGDHAFNIIKMHGSFVTFGAQTKCAACGYYSHTLQSLNNIKQINCLLLYFAGPVSLFFEGILPSRGLVASQCPEVVARSQGLSFDQTSTT